MKVVRSRPAATGKGSRGLRTLAGLAVAVSLAGCASSISTPLPDLPHSRVSTSMSQQERQKAVDDLARARDTHEQDAERQIEQSR